MTTHRTRRYAQADAAWALALNNAAVPAVNEHDDDSLHALIGCAATVLVAETDDGPTGLLVLFREGAAYQSPNYRWFADRFDRFLYVDRVIVEPDARGLGLGTLLYQSALDLGRLDDVPVLTCEVNEQPPNPRSRLFHERFGFQVAGRQETDGGKKTVTLLTLEIGET